MKTTINHNLTLDSALHDLVEAAVRKDDVSVPLLGLQVALATNPPCAAEREDAVTSAFAALQQHVYDEAVREYRGPLASYLYDKTDALIDLYDRLSAEGYVPPACKAAPKVTAWMHEKLTAATGEDVEKFEDVLLEAMGSFVPAAQKLCVNALLFAVQAYVAGEYLSLSTFIADAMDEPPAGQAARTLYAALLDADNLDYAVDFLFYDNGSFSLAGANSVCAAKDCSTLALCLERLAEGLQRVPADLAERIVLDLKREITLRLADFISENCTEKLSPAGLTCLDRIPALLSNVSVPEGDELDAVELTEAVSLLSYVATANKDGALLSLSELALALDRSPVFHDALTERAASALLLRVLGELDSLNVVLPPIESILTRLYLALDLRGAAALTDDAALSCVCEEV